MRENRRDISRRNAARHDKIETNASPDQPARRRYISSDVQVTAGGTPALRSTQESGMTPLDIGAPGEDEARFSCSFELRVKVLGFDVAGWLYKQKKRSGFRSGGDFPEEWMAVRKFVDHGEGEGEIDASF